MVNQVGGASRRGHFIHDERMLKNLREQGRIVRGTEFIKNPNGSYCFNVVDRLGSRKGSIVGLVGGMTRAMDADTALTTFLKGMAEETVIGMIRDNIEQLRDTPENGGIEVPPGREKEVYEAIIAAGNKFPKFKDESNFQTALARFAPKETPQETQAEEVATVAAKRSSKGKGATKDEQTALAYELLVTTDLAARFRVIAEYAGNPANQPTPLMAALAAEAPKVGETADMKIAKEVLVVFALARKGSGRAQISEQTKTIADPDNRPILEAIACDVDNPLAQSAVNFLTAISLVDQYDVSKSPKERYSFRRQRDARAYAVEIAGLAHIKNNFGAKASSFNSDLYDEANILHKLAKPDSPVRTADLANDNNRPLLAVIAKDSKEPQAPAAIAVLAKLAEIEAYSEITKQLAYTGVKLATALYNYRHKSDLDPRFKDLVKILKDNAYPLAETARQIAKDMRAEEDALSFIRTYFKKAEEPGLSPQDFYEYRQEPRFQRELSQHQTMLQVLAEAGKNEPARDILAAVAPPPPAAGEVALTERVEVQTLAVIMADRFRQSLATTPDLTDRQAALDAIFTALYVMETGAPKPEEIKQANRLVINASTAHENDSDIEDLAGLVFGKVAGLRKLYEGEKKWEK